MPSRTYIQMILKLHNNGKIHLSKVTLYFLNRYNTVLENHPEAIEEIVKKRVNIVWYIRNINPIIKMTWLNYVIYEQCFLDSMFKKELHSEAEEDYERMMKLNFPENAKPYKLMGHDIQFVSYDEHLAMHRGDKEIEKC